MKTTFRAQSAKSEMKPKLNETQQNRKINTTQHKTKRNETEKYQDGNSHQERLLSRTF